MDFRADVLIPLVELPPPHYFYRHYFLTFHLYCFFFFHICPQSPKKHRYGLWHRQNQTENPSFHNLCERKSQSSDRSLDMDDSLNHGSPTRNPPGYIMQSAAAFPNYVYIIKMSQSFRTVSIPSIVIFPHAACEPAHNKGCGCLPQNVWIPMV